MIRNLMLAAGLFAFTAGSAMAGTQPRAGRTPKVARALEAPSAADKETKKAPRKSRKSKKAKAAEGTAQVEAPAPAK